MARPILRSDWSEDIEQFSITAALRVSSVVSIATTQSQRLIWQTFHII